MSQTVAGFPFWEAAFDQDGRPQAATALAKAIQEIKAANLTDLFVFSHGWNNDHNSAQVLYNGFFGEVRKLIDNPGFAKKREARCGIVGVFWPSIMWPDEKAAAAGQSEGGAAALEAAGDAAQLPSLDDLIKVFGQDRAGTLQRILELLDGREGGQDGLREVSEKLASLLEAQDKKTGSDDSFEFEALSDRSVAWEEVFEALADQETAETEGGAAGFGDGLEKLWNGAKGALRVATYWQMKNRAGVVGRAGLAPFIKQLADSVPALNVQLLGHSFGARLVSYSLAGLNLQPAASPVKSLFLLQGAFSHFTFAPVLPFDETRSGDLKGKDGMVNGPMLTTFSASDLAVGRAYPLASFASRVDAAGVEVSRWGGMGNDGAQAVNANPVTLAPAGSDYQFKKHEWYNLDSNEIIKTGGLPSGSHSDIIHPETAWAALSAAAIV